MTTSDDGSAAEKISGNADPGQWLDQYGDFLYRRALLLLGKPENAEDLLQDTLLSAYQAFDSFRGESSIKTWLARILKNKAIDYMRKAARREIPTSFEEENAEESHDFSSWGIWKNVEEKWALWDKTGYTQLENQSMLKTLANCIEKLPSSQKNVLKLRAIEEFSIEDICKNLELSASNVGVLLFRARLGLRNCLEINWFKKD